MPGLRSTANQSTAETAYRPDRRSARRVVAAVHEDVIQAHWACVFAPDLVLRGFAREGLSKSHTPSGTPAFLCWGSNAWRPCGRVALRHCDWSPLQ
jgi:hypothetical protein